MTIKQKITYIWKDQKTYVVLKNRSAIKIGNICGFIELKFQLSKPCKKSVDECSKQPFFTSFCNTQWIPFEEKLMKINANSKINLSTTITVNCFNDISVNANLISVRLKSKRQRINTINFYLHDILMLLVGVVFKHHQQCLKTTPTNGFKVSRK